MRRLILLAVLALPSLAAAQETLTIDPAESTLRYNLIHKMHKVEGISKKVEGKAQLLADGKAQVMVKAPVESFDSGNVNRDAHMKEAVEAARYPHVQVKALADGMKPPATFPTTEKKTFKLQLQFHGETKVFDVPVEVTWESPTRVRAKTTFNVSLDAYKVERPSLMFVKVEDALVMEAKLLFKK
jgi:polyisoprenoid-binding protein YceI